MLAQVVYSVLQCKKYICPKAHWNRNTSLPYKLGKRAGQLIHIGRQVALKNKAQVLHHDDMTAQTQIAMGNISCILEDFYVTINKSR